MAVWYVACVLCQPNHLLLNAAFSCMPAVCDVNMLVQELLQLLAPTTAVRT